MHSLKIKQDETLLFQSCDYYSNLYININEEGADVSKLSSHPQSDQDFVFLWKTAESQSDLTADINNRFSSRFPPDLSSALSMRHWIINWIILISLVIMLCNGLIKSCSPGDPASEKDVDPWLCDWWMLVLFTWAAYGSRVVRSQFRHISSSHTHKHQISCLPCWIQNSPIQNHYSSCNSRLQPWMWTIYCFRQWDPCIGGECEHTPFCLLSSSL